jgi:hypothetical protein
VKEIRQQDVEARLCAEARDIRARAGFSRLLHERCMAALRREGLQGAQTLPMRRRAIGRVAAAAGVAAAAAVGIWLVVRAPEMPEAPAPTVAGDILPAIPRDASPAVDAQAASGMFEERKYAYLDRDAKKLLAFVANQFPEFPPDAGNRAPGNGGK